MQTNSESSMQPWDVFQQLSAVDATELRYSAGFLRAQPERWFPGLLIRVKRGVSKRIDQPKIKPCCSSGISHLPIGDGSKYLSERHTST